MRLIGFCISVLYIAALAAPPAFAERVTVLDVWLGYESGGHTYLAQDLPFPEATIVVVHPWPSRAATTYLITLDGAPLAVLGAGQHVVWRTAPRDLILGMQSRDGLHLTHFIRAEPGGTYYFRTSRQGLGRATQAEGKRSSNSAGRPMYRRTDLLDDQFTRYDDLGRRVEHSPTSATGTGWERTPWHAVQGGRGRG
jgi:hypothetical protein